MSLGVIIIADLEHMIVDTGALIVLATHLKMIDPACSYDPCTLHADLHAWL